MSGKHAKGNSIKHARGHPMVSADEAGDSVPQKLDDATGGRDEAAAPADGQRGNFDLVE